MTLTIGLIFLCLALICFVAAAFGATFPRVGLTDLGLAFLTLALIFGR